MSTSQQRQQPFDLASYQAGCDHCYGLLDMLMPVWVGEVIIDIPRLTSDPLILNVVDKHKHTVFIDVLLPTLPKVRWLKPAVARVLVYTDVKMAEVVAWNRHRVVWPRLTFPNPDRLSSNEKYQRNQLLIEWLTCAARHGVASYSALAL